MIMELELAEILQGTFCLIFTVITIIVGIKIMSKYFKYRRREHFIIGLTWILITGPWLAMSIDFLMIISIGTTLYNISKEAYAVIAMAFLPIASFFWISEITKLTDIKNQNRIFILVICLVLFIIFEIIFFYFLFTDLTLIGTFKGVFDFEFTIFSEIYLIFCLLVFLMGMFLFARASLRSINPEIKLRGKIIFTSFISYIGGAILDMVFPFLPITLVARLILISSSIEFYIGFIMPKWAKKLFLKEK